MCSASIRGRTSMNIGTGASVSQPNSQPTRTRICQVYGAESLRTPEAGNIFGMPAGGLDRSGRGRRLELVEGGRRLFDDRPRHIRRERVSDDVALALRDDGAELA